MKRSFRAILAEQDQEFTFVVKSIYNIHAPDMMDWVRLALLPYDLRELTKGTYTPPSKDQKTFPNVPNAPVYTLKAKLGLEPAWEDATEKVSLFTRIEDIDHIICHKEGTDPQKDMDNGDDKDETKKDYKSLAKHAIDWNATPDEEVDKDGQEGAGEKRIGALMKELEKERKDREDLVPKVDPNLKESFVTTHVALKGIMGSKPKGFYIVERRIEDDRLLRLQGPYRKQPINYQFVGNLDHPAVSKYTKLGESTIYLTSYGKDFTYVNENAKTSILKEVNYQVEVQDQDTGRSYVVNVEAMDDASARDAASRLVASENKLDQNRLIASDPELAG